GSLGLRDGWGEAVHDEALLAVALLQAVADDADHDVVRHVAARGHDGLRFEAERRAGCDLSPQDVAGGDVRDVEGAVQQLRLGAFAAPRRAVDEEVQRPLLTSPHGGEEPWLM